MASFKVVSPHHGYKNSHTAAKRNGKDGNPRLLHGIGFQNFECVLYSSSYLLIYILS